jgi:hypothetical protein
MTSAYVQLLWKCGGCYTRLGLDLKEFVIGYVAVFRSLMPGAMFGSLIDASQW